MTDLSGYLGSQAFNHLCQKFVEQATYGRTGMYPTAIAAWNAQAAKAYKGINGAQPGDLVYFSPNTGNGNAGHTGIYLGNNQFISATDQGVRKTDLDQWQQATGQQLLGYIPQGHAVGVSGLAAGAQMAQMDGQPQQPTAPQEPTWMRNVRLAQEQARISPQAQSYSQPIPPYYQPGYGL